MLVQFSFAFLVLLFMHGGGGSNAVDSGLLGA